MSAKSKRKKKKQYIKEQFEALSKTFYEKPGVGVAKVKEIRKSHAKQIFRSKQADWIAQDVKELIQTLSCVQNFEVNKPELSERGKFVALSQNAGRFTVALEEVLLQWKLKSWKSFVKMYSGG